MSKQLKVTALETSTPNKITEGRTYLVEVDDENTGYWKVLEDDLGGTSGVRKERFGPATPVCVVDRTPLLTCGSFSASKKTGSLFTVKGGGVMDGRIDVVLTVGGLEALHTLLTELRKEHGV